MKDKTSHVQRKLFVSQMALQLQVALCWNLLNTKQHLINLFHMLFGLTKQAINLSISSMLLKSQILMLQVDKLFSVSQVMDVIETGLKLHQTVVQNFHQTIRNFALAKEGAGLLKNISIIPLFNQTLNWQ